MDESKLLKSDTQYLELAKEITSNLHDLCIESKQEYNISTVIMALGVGVYMFVKELSDVLNISVDVILEDTLNWINYANSKLNKTN